MRNLKKGLCILSAGLLIMISCTITQAKEGKIVIDGNFSDWEEQSELTYTEVNTANLKRVAAILDEDLYIYVESDVNWASLSGVALSFQYQNTSIDKKLEIQNVNNDRFSLVLKEMPNYQTIQDTEASGSLQGTHNIWEIKIPKEWVGSPESIGIGEISIPVTKVSEKEEGTDPEPETPSQPDTGGSETVPKPETGIVIDGSYDDWDHLAHSDLSWDNGKDPKACAVMSQGNICVHVNKKYRQGDYPISHSTIVLKVNGTKYESLPINLREIDANGNIATDPLDTSRIEPNSKFELVATINNAGEKFVLGKAFYTTDKLRNREDFEFCMNLEILEKALGVTINSGTEIEIFFPSIGEGSVVIEATSTGPWILVGIGILVAFGGVLLNKKKQHR